MKIKIKIPLKDIKTGKEGWIKTIILDGKSATTYPTHQQAELTFKKMKEEDIKCLFAMGIIVQYYVGKKAEEIKQNVYNQIKWGLAKTESKVEVGEPEEEILE